jgi:tripartite motif-containing protein 33
MGSFGPNNHISIERQQQQQAAQQQAAAMQQMRNSYMNQSGHFGSSNQNGQMSANANVMSNAAAMQRYQQMQSSRQQMMNQMRSNPNMLAAAAAAQSMKSSSSSSAPNSMRFPPQQNPNINPQTQATFNQSSVQAQQQAQLAAAQLQASNVAKLNWHTPQQKQSSHGSGGLSALGMSPPANNFINDSFKIPLRSPDTLRNNSNGSNSNHNHSSNSSSSVGNQNSNSHHQSSSASLSTSSPSSFPIPLPNVTSSNPKTPSPSSQKDNTKDMSDSIDMVCNETVVDLLATIAKLDSNGVQVVPEGRNKATSPQVHSSTDTLDPNTINLNDKNNQPKDDPNEDWCAVCMGETLKSFYNLQVVHCKVIIDESEFIEP